MTSTEQIASKDEDDEQIVIVESKPWYLNWQTWLKIVIVLIILSFIVIAIIFNKTTGKILTDFLEWMQENAAAGAFAFIGLYWFCTVLFIPGSLLTLGAGVVFRVVAGPWGGVFLATLVVLCGAGLGASTAFLLGRFVFREKVASYKSKYEKFDIIDKVVEQQGLKVTILLRLSPVIPFSAFNYFMGLTGVSFRDYNIAHVGMIPGTLAYCFIGGTLGAIGESVGFADPVVLTVTIVGTVLAIIGMVYISIVAKKEFAKIAAAQQLENNNDDGNDVAGANGGDTEQGMQDTDDVNAPITASTVPESYGSAQADNDPELEDSKSLSVGN